MTLPTQPIVISSSAPTLSLIRSLTLNRRIIQEQPPAGTIARDPAHDPARKGQPPQGFKDPVAGSPGTVIPERPTTESFTDRPAQSTVNDVLGLVDQNTTIQTLLGRASATDQNRKGINTDLTPQKGGTPGIDQGFESKPTSVGDNPLTTPMKDYQGGSAGSALTSAAKGNTATPADFKNLGLISDQPNPGQSPLTSGNGASFDDQEGVKATGSGNEAHTRLQRLLNWLDEMFDDGTSPADANEVAKAALGIGSNRMGSDILEDERWKSSSDDVSSTYTYPDGSKDVYSNFKKVGHIDKNGDIKPVDAGRPDPENAGSRVNVVSQSILDQLRTAPAGKPARKGGGGDIKPAVEDGNIGVARDGSITQYSSANNSRNLFGQPGGQAIGDNISGGDKGIDRFGGNVGAGVINPGPDGGNPRGDSRFSEDPAGALGDGKPKQNLNDHAPSSGGNFRSQTGTAANDLLIGGAGIDQFTGGLGADRFRIAAGSGFGSSRDRITDFTRSQGDRIEISREAIGASSTTAMSLARVTSQEGFDQALTSSTLFIQDQRTNTLYFNQNGRTAGFGSGGAFAELTNGAMLLSSDLALVA